MTQNAKSTSTAASPKWVYRFGGGTADGKAAMKELLGGKGANLAEMASLGLPVPPGFTITTEVCTYYYANGRQLPPQLEGEVSGAMDEIGRSVGATFGDAANPLLVSVRSGARTSMPGMMDTILNLGLNDTTVEGLAVATKDERFAYDSYRRFIQMFSDVVLGVDHSVFEDILDDHKSLKGLTQDTELTGEHWKAVIADFKQAVQRETGKPFPQETRQQLWAAIGAVFGSWMSARAITYRKLNTIPEHWGTAVNVQAMVFGNRGETSATGVAFTRNPATGAAELFGEFLANAQGEDVVAGIRTPQSLSERARKAAGDSKPSLEQMMPVAYGQFVKAVNKLEKHYRDMQDVEFTIQEGQLWMLQTRSGKRTTKAALKIAVDLAEEGVISREVAVSRIEPAQLDQLLHPTIDPDAEKTVIATGLPASPGAATGEIVFNADEAEALKSQGHEVLLVRVETSPEDIHGMAAASGILTARGGMTSHAAVVARGMGRPCVSGAGALRIDYAKGIMTVGSLELKKGDIVTIDGTTGQVLKGRVPMRQPELSGDFAKLMTWADSIRRLKVRANAETPRDARQAREFGAEGIGLCRTEHMFFETDRILAVREMILADSEEGRRHALAKILPMQRKDFTELFEIMAGFPVTIRLLDPPLHEFLPHEEKEIGEVAEALSVSPDKVRRRLSELAEFNPMLGFRGCRLGLVFPEITEMQARAIFEAALAAAKSTGKPVIPEVMVPLVGFVKELEFLKGVIAKTAEAVEKETGSKLVYHVGTMIELPRAALMAGEIAGPAEFFSFGTNDLTQTTLGLSRDDAAPILASYLSKGILADDPFVTMDLEGVGQMVAIATERGRKARPDIKLGICGEHGGDPRSIAFCDKTGLDYVSCSPFRVPVARLAAAQAKLKGMAGSLDKG